MSARSQNANAGNDAVDKLRYAVQARGSENLDGRSYASGGEMMIHTQKQVKRRRRGSGCCWWRNWQMRRKAWHRPGEGGWRGPAQSGRPKRSHRVSSRPPRRRLRCCSTGMPATAKLRPKQQQSLIRAPAHCGRGLSHRRRWQPGAACEVERWSEDMGAL